LARKQAKELHTAKGRGNSISTSGRKYTQTSDTFKPKKAGGVQYAKEESN